MGMRKHRVSRLGMRTIAGTAMATAVMGISPTVLADYTGPTTTNSGTITIDSEQVNDRLQARGEGVIEINGGSVDTANNSPRGAVVARDGGTVTLDGTTVNHKGRTGLFAFGGSSGPTSITATDINLSITGAANGPTEAVYVYSAFGNVKPLADIAATQGFDEGDVVGLTPQEDWLTPGVGQAVYDALDGVTPEIDTRVTLDGGTITVDRGDGTEKAFGLRSFYSNTKTTAKDLAINVTGTDSLGAYVEGSNLELVNTDINMVGDKATGIFANGLGGPTLPFLASDIDVTGGSITTDGDRAFGIEAKSGPWAHQTTISLEGTTITTQGDESFGLLLNENGEHSDGVKATLNDVAIATSGQDAYGIFVADAAEDFVKVTGGSIDTTGTDGHGVVVSNGGLIQLDDVAISTQGDGAYGIYMDGADKSWVTTTGGSIVTTGDNAHGIRVGNDQVASIDGTTIDAQGAGAYVVGNASLGMENATVRSAGASFVSELTQAGQAQSISIGQGTTATDNNGHLLVVHRDNQAMDGRVNLHLGAGSVSAGDIVDTDGLNADGVRDDGGTVVLDVEQDAQWTGRFTGPMKNAFLMQGSALTFEGATTINDIILAQKDTAIVFNGDAFIGGVGGQGIATSGALSFSQSPDTQAVIVGDVSLSDHASIRGGSLENPVAINGDLDGRGDLVSGNLAIDGNLTLANTTLSPGNSIGVITATSLNTTGLNSTYHAEINGGGQADLVHITGTNPVDLSGLALEVAQENGNGGFVLDHDYTVLKADGGLKAGTAFASAGLDDSFDDTLVHLDPVKYGYGAGQVQISLSADQVAIAGFSGSANQVGTLGGVASVADHNPVAAAAMLSTDSAAALDQLSGEYHASRASALVADSRYLRKAVNDRLASDGGLSNVWAQTYGSWGDFSGDSNAAGMDYDARGLFIGADRLVAPNARLGFVMGVGHGSTDTANASGTDNSFRLGLYGDYTVGPWGVNAGVSHAWHDLKGDRTVAFDGVNQALSTDTDATSTQLFAELGYTLDYGDTQVTPFLRGAYVHLSTDSFTERGGDAALHVAGDSSDLGVTLTGLRASSTLNPGSETTVQLRGMLAWQHAFGDTTPKATMAFDGGDAFSVSGVALGKDALVADMGLDVDVSDTLTIGAGYTGQFGNGLDSNGVNANLVWQF